MQAAGEERLATFEHLSEDEWQAMRVRWDEGRMRGYVALLPEFIDRHREEILARAGPPEEARALLTAVKLVLLDRGSLDQRDELATQRRKISDHIWIGVERTHRDPRILADEWVVNYAAPWRGWRMKKYLYVINRCADDVVARLRSAPPRRDSPLNPAAPAAG